MEKICPKFNFQGIVSSLPPTSSLKNSFLEFSLLKKLLWLFMVTAVRFTCEVSIQTNSLSYQIFNCFLCTSYQHEYLILPLKWQAFSTLSSPSSSHLEVLHSFLLRQILHFSTDQASFLDCVTVTAPSLAPLALTSWSFYYLHCIFEHICYNLPAFQVQLYIYVLCLFKQFTNISTWSPMMSDR